MTVIAFDTALLVKKNTPYMFAQQFTSMTAASEHPYEAAVHKLLCDLMEYMAHDILSGAEYEITLGTAMDVMLYFNLDLHSLALSEAWYRVCVIHQMG